MGWKEKVEKALKLIQEARATMDEHQGKDSWTKEMEAQVDAKLDEADRLKAEADREKKAADLKGYFEDPVRTMPLNGGSPEGKAFDQKDTSVDEKAAGEFRKKAFQKYLHQGKAGLVSAEAKALSTESDPEGGYIAPEDFRAQLIKKLRDVVAVRGLSFVITTNAGSVGFPSFDYDGDADVVGENAPIGTEDIVNAFGKESFTPHKRARIFRIPIELIEDAAFDVEALLAQHFAMRFGEIEENDFLNGDGVHKPLGLLQAGLPTLDSAVTTGSGFSNDDLIDTVYAIRSVYRSNAKWLFHRTGLKGVRKLKDGEGRYVWQPATQAGEPPVLHGFPVYESEWMPDLTGAVGSNKVVSVFGDFQYYWIVDNRGIAVQRLVERYAEFDQVGFKIRKRTDAAPVDSNAFRLLRQKSS